jgi:hypothetical protein
VLIPGRSTIFMDQLSTSHVFRKVYAMAVSNFSFKSLTHTNKSTKKDTKYTLIWFVDEFLLSKNDSIYLKVCINIKSRKSWGVRVDLSEACEYLIWTLCVFYIFIFYVKVWVVLYIHTYMFICFVLLLLIPQPTAIFGELWSHGMLRMYVLL